MSQKTFRIFLNDVRIYAYHGVMKQESRVGGWYRVSLAVDYDFSEALETDDVADTLDYSKLLDIVKREMQTPSKLIEHVAGRICKSLFSSFSNIHSAEIKITKENPPMGSDTAGAGVLLRLKNDKTC
jgi:dihydroneopterin aldolase